MSDFEQQLTGGHPNSLGNTEAVVEQVLADTNRLEELYQCYFSEDEVVRLRTSSALKRVCIARKDLMVPYIDRLLTEITQIDQASTQWTLAIYFDLLKKDLTTEQHTKALAHMKHNIEHHDDWIVLNTTMNTLVKWAKKDEKLQNWLRPQLERLKSDKRKSVAGKATKLLAKL